VKKTGIIDPTFIKTNGCLNLRVRHSILIRWRTLYEAHIKLHAQSAQGRLDEKQADARNILYLSLHKRPRGDLGRRYPEFSWTEWTIFDIADPRWKKQFVQDTIKENFPRFIRGRESSYTMMDGFYLSVRSSGKLLRYGSLVPETDVRNLL